MQRKHKFLMFILIFLNICLLYKQYSIKKTLKKENIDISIWSGKEELTEEKIEKMSNEYQNKIRIYYPKSNDPILNDEIKNKIEIIKLDFEKEIENIEAKPNKYYTLFINYDAYSYKNYISYVFYVEEYIGGAHPNTTIFTIVYDKKEQKFITIDTLIERNSNILNLLSKYSREEFEVSKTFTENKDLYLMLQEGTKPTTDNFKRFAFSENGLILFFEQYQIAPYSEGIFQITIPYSRIKNISN